MEWCLTSGSGSDPALLTAGGLPAVVLVSPSVSSLRQGNEMEVEAGENRKVPQEVGRGCLHRWLRDVYFGSRMCQTSYWGPQRRCVLVFLNQSAATLSQSAVTGP